MPRAVQVGLCCVLRHADKRRDFGDAGAHPVVQPQGRLVDLGQFPDAFCQGLIAACSFKAVEWVSERRGRLSQYLFTQMRGSIADPCFQVDRLVEGDAVDP